MRSPGRPPICSASSARTIERRSVSISRTSARSSGESSCPSGKTSRADLVLPAAPAGIPFSYEEHVELMYDLLALAYQANVTRVFTFMVAREVSNRTYPQVGVPDGHHAISHHQNRAEKLEKNVKIQEYHAGLFAHFLEKLRSTPDGDGSLLDHSVILYGSNMSNSNAHDHFPLPNLVVGGASGPAQGRTPPQVSRSHADDEPARDAAGQGRRPHRQLGDSNRIAGESVMNPFRRGLASADRSG